MQKYHSLHTKKTLLTFLFLVSSLTALLLLIPAEKEASIYENTFRVHIIAASDQSQDQAIKYTLRDKLMPSVTALVAHCQTPKETEAVLLAHQEEILVQAQDILKNQGYIKGVSVEIGEFRYDKRVLDGKIYPGGVVIVLLLFHLVPPMPRLALIEAVGALLSARIVNGLVVARILRSRVLFAEEVVEKGGFVYKIPRFCGQNIAVLGTVCRKRGRHLIGVAEHHGIAEANVPEPCRGIPSLVKA